MNDRKLLEMAAKAAGVIGEYSEWWEMGEQFYSGFREDRVWGAWNPLLDDGDALRLAVKLQIHFSVYGPETGMDAWVVGATAESFAEDYGKDPCKSARRAIVRAAAAIGEAMS